MTAEQPSLRALADLISEMSARPRRELHCGAGVIMWLRLTTPEAAPAPPWSGAISGLAGVPLIDSPDLGRGDWEIREDGEVTDSGHLEIPEFVTRPIEFSFDSFPDLTSRRNWQLGALPLPAPTSPIIVTGI